MLFLNMRSFCRYFLLALLFVCLTAASVHKFYVGIHQINYASDKKMLQITSRIFVDDLNDVLQQKYKKKFSIGEASETPEQIALMQKYLAEHFIIKVDGKEKPIQYLSNEIESNVIICYFNVRDISKIKTLYVANKILFDFVTEQQNIIQTTVNGQKKSLLLTADNAFGTLSY